MLVKEGPVAPALAAPLSSESEGVREVSGADKASLDDIVLADRPAVDRTAVDTALGEGTGVGELGQPAT